MLKAEFLLNVLSDLKPGKGIKWPVYNGYDISEAKTVEDHVNVFFKTGNIMPIPVTNLGLNISSVQTEFDDYNNSYRVIIEGIVTRFESTLDYPQLISKLERR